MAAKKFLASIAVAVMLCSGAVSGLEPTNITAEEWALAPSYCPDTLNYSPPKTLDQPNERQRHWLSLYGHKFWGLYHYCWAVWNIARADRLTIPMPTAIRKGLYREAIGDIDFVLNGTPPDYILAPELNTKKGEAFFKLREDRSAEFAFKRAIRARPDYWPAYLAWATMYRTRGRLADARAIVEEGLKYAPDATALKGMLEILHGNSPASPRTGASPPRIAAPDPVAQQPKLSPPTEASGRPAAGPKGEAPVTR